MTPYIEGNILTISMRDPSDNEFCNTAYWLNIKTYELFIFTDRWVSLSKKYVENIQSQEIKD